MVPMGFTHASDGLGRTRPVNLFATEPNSPSCRVSEWPFAGHSFTARELRWGRSNLRAEIEIAGGSAGQGADTMHFGRAQSQKLGRGARVRLLPRLDGPLPRDEGAVWCEEGRRVLEQHAEGRQ